MLPTLKFYPELLVKYVKARGFENVSQYQLWHGLQVDGDAGPVFTRHIMQPRVCSHPDKMEPEVLRFANYGYYPSGFVIKWCFRKDPSTFPSLNSNGWTTNWVDGLQDAFERWSKHLDIHFAYAKNDNQAHWVIDTGRIDGPSGTLAWAELPPTKDYTGRLNQKIDTTERLIFSNEAQVPGGYIDLGRTMCHEAGHSLGLGHLPTRTHRGALLNPMYGSVMGPTNYDIKELRKVYSAASSGIPDNPSDPGNNDDSNDEPTEPGDDRILVYKGNKHGVAKKFKHIQSPELFKISWVD